MSITNMFGLMLITAGVIGWFKAEGFGHQRMLEIADALGGTVLVGAGWFVVLFV